MKGLFKFIMWLVFLACVGLLVAWYFFDMKPQETWNYVLGKSRTVVQSVKSEGNEVATTAKNIPGIKDRQLNRANDRIDKEF